MGDLKLAMLTMLHKLENRKSNMETLYNTSTYSIVQWYTGKQTLVKYLEEMSIFWEEDKD